jgi:hypothetical protein
MLIQAKKTLSKDVPEGDRVAFWILFGWVIYLVF